MESILALLTVANALAPTIANLIVNVRGNTVTITAQLDETDAAIAANLAQIEQWVKAHPAVAPAT